jgi:hypothetical protein
MTDDQIQAFWRRRRLTGYAENVCYPSLPPVRKEANGNHWGMKHGIGWSDPTDCPDMAILMNAFIEGRIAAIQEAIQHYGPDLVAQVWRIARQNEPWAQRPSQIYDTIDTLLLTD